MLLLLIRRVCLANKLDGKFLEGGRLALLHLRVGVTAYIQQAPRRVCGHHKSVGVTAESACGPSDHTPQNRLILEKKKKGACCFAMCMFC